VYKDDDRMRARAGGQPQFADPICVLPVRNVLIGMPHRQLADIGRPDQRWRRLLGLTHDNGAVSEKNRDHRLSGRTPLEKRPSWSHAGRYHSGRSNSALRALTP